MHHQWPRITTVDNNNSSRILILISLICSSMLATNSQLPDEQMATKRKCFVVKHYLLFIFFIVSCNDRGGTPPLSAAVASLGGDSESEVKWVSAKSRQPPPSLPQHTLTQIMLGCCQSQTWSQFSMRFQRARSVRNTTLRRRPESGWLFLNCLRLIFNSWREEYLTLISGGRIPRRIVVVYMYVKHGVAPDDCVNAFQDSRLIQKRKWSQIFNLLM